MLKAKDIIVGSDDFQPVTGEHLLELLQRALPPRRRYDSSINRETNRGMTYFDDYSEYESAIWHLVDCPRRAPHEEDPEAVGDWERIIAARTYTVPQMKQILKDLLESEPNNNMVPPLPQA